MTRPVSFLATGLILLVALSALLVAGCGGGGGAAEGGRTLQSAQGTGSLSLRVSRGAAADALELRGDEVVLAVASPSPSLTTLRVNLYSLPVGQSPTPVISREFAITPETASVTVQDIPVGTYLLEVLSFDAFQQALGQFKLEITIEPGRIASVQASLTPVVSPSPTATLSPGPIRQVTTSILPARLPRIAMTSSGEFVVGWVNSAARGTDGVFATSYDAAGNELAAFTDRIVGALPAGSTVQDHGLALSEDGKLLVAVGSQQQPQVGGRTEALGMIAVLTSEVFSRTTGVSLDVARTIQQNTDEDWLDVHAMLPALTTTLTGAVLHLERNASSYDSSAGLTFTIPPAEYTTPDLIVFGLNLPFTMSGAAMVEDEVGNYVHAMANKEGSVYKLAGTLYDNGIDASSGFDVDLAIPDLVAPDVELAVRNGRFAIVWTKEQGGALHVFYALYSFDPGNTGTAPTLLHSGQVSNAAASNVDPDVGLDAQGNLVVTWTHFPAGGEDSRLMGRAFRAAGAAGSPFEVSLGLANTQNNPGRIGMASGGGFQVTWLDPSNGNLYLRAFPAGFGQP